MKLFDISLNNFKLYVIDFKNNKHILIIRLYTMKFHLYISWEPVFCCGENVYGMSFKAGKARSQEHETFILHNSVTFITCETS